MLKYQSLINKMTLKEKASLMSGANFWNTKEIERLNIPSMMLTDGPHGVRKQGGKADHLGLNKSIPATCFPTAATLANSWDLNLLYEVGSLLGTEASYEDVNVLLGPGLNIKRNPLCGRNFEYFSEDPYLTGKMAKSIINGIQSKGISACPKHFAVNSQETHRMIINEIVDKRALHEIYLEGFRIAVKEGNPKTIMTSYNKVNGIYANENEYLVKDILREKWGFNGLIVTDWGGSNDRISGLKAGNALEMPSTNKITDLEVEKAVKENKLDEGILDKRVDELLSVIFQTKEHLSRINKLDYDLHHKKAIEVAAKSMVLLKNMDDILPLKNKEVPISIIGDFAKKPRYQGAGSSLINPTKVDDFLTVFKNTDFNFIGYEKGFKRLGGKSNTLVKKACHLSKKSELVLLFLGLDEGSEAEGVDRKHMKLSKNQVDLFNEIYKVNQNIIVILSGGSPIEMPFYKKAKAILHTYLSGQGAGCAVNQVLTGKVNPSGKLAETYPINYKDCPTSDYFPGRGENALHKESIYVGYRYYDLVNKDVLFPFGFGLSYSKFEYKDVYYDNKKVSLTVKNTSKIDGEEVVQVYIKAINSNTFKPEKELKGFKKILVKAGEYENIEIELDHHTFSHFDVERDQWITEKGEYEILIGSSSRDIRKKIRVSVDGESVKSNRSIKEYMTGQVKDISDQTFEKLLGTKIIEDDFNTKKVLGYNDIIKSGKNAGLFGKILFYLILLVNKFYSILGKPRKANNVMFVLEMPFRSVARMSAGKVNYPMLDGILMMVNGHFLKGLPKFIKEVINK